MPLDLPTPGPNDEWGAPLNDVLNKWHDSTQLLLDVKPTSPSALDDEFDGTTLDPKWAPATSHVNAATSTTVTNGRLFVEPAATGTASTGRGGFGLRQVAPSGSFSASVKVMDGSNVDDARVGVWVASTSNAKGHILGSQMFNNRFANANDFPYSDTEEWGAFSGLDTFPSTGAATGTGWYRIRWDATAGTFTFEYSRNGFFWLTLSTRTGQVQPDRVGLGIWANEAAIRANHAAAFEWFRVTTP